MGIEATARHAQYKLPLNLIAGPDASVAIDAFTEVRGHIGVAEVFFPLEVVLPFRVAHLPDPNLCRYRL